MEFQLRNTQPDLFILLTDWVLNMRTYPMTFHIAFRTTLLTGCDRFNHFLQLTPFIRTGKGIWVEADRERGFPFRLKKKIRISQKNLIQRS